MNELDYNSIIPHKSIFIIRRWYIQPKMFNGTKNLKKKRLLNCTDFDKGTFDEIINQKT